MPLPRLARFVPQRGRWLLAGVLAAGLAIAAYFVTRPSRPAPLPSAPLPPLTQSPFLNTKPGLAYVGDARCAECHADQSRAYRQHPMGRSLFTAAAAPPLEKYEKSANNPFQAGPLHFQVLRQGTRLIHKEWCEDANGKVVAQQEADITYAIGSGTQARSYLWQRDGALFQSPITWYTHTADGKSQWGLSPNYDSTPYHFYRQIDPRCLYCHCQEARQVADSVNRYENPPFSQPAIGCERCHGPGELHVADHTDKPAGAIDRTIVNPKHLEPALREAICEQCHLQGEAIVVRRGRDQRDYRPGLPIAEYMAVFVRPAAVADAQLIVSHVEQMHQSVCFAKSGGKFGCTSCHDPHGQPTPDQKDAHYRRACLGCHGAQHVADSRHVKAAVCSLPLAQRQTPELRDNCVGCHMPHNASSNVTHLAVTDHRVPRKRGASAMRTPAPRPGDIPLIAFHRAAPGSADEEAGRDLALGLNQLAERVQSVGMENAYESLTRHALPLLESAARRAPDDIPVLEARASALRAQGRRAEALEAIEHAVAQAPNREDTLNLAMRIAEAAARLDRAVSYGERLVQKYPHFPNHRYRLAVIYALREAWPQALEAAQAAVDANPFHAESRALLVTALIETGSRDRARAEFAVLGAINPKYQEKTRAWFNKRLGKGS